MHIQQYIKFVSNARESTTTMYMESMDEEIKEKIRIQGHKIKSLSHSLIRSNNIDLHDFHMYSPSHGCGEIKSDEA